MIEMESILARVDMEEVPGCWVWKGSTVGEGYPAIRLQNKGHMVRRLVYEIVTGAGIPRGVFIHTTCGRMDCVHPDHLEGGPGKVSEGQDALEGKAVIRFWRTVEKLEGVDACWLWRGYTLNSGYGLIHIGNRHVTTHRYSYELANGPPASNLVVRHKCDVPKCVRPDHLVIGTHRDNVMDMHERGRGRRGPTRSWQQTHPDLVSRGEDSVRATLTNAEALDIREKFNSGAITQLDLAAMYGVSNATISHIVRNETYNTPEAIPKSLQKVALRGHEAIISEETAKEIVRRYLAGDKRQLLAKEFKVSHVSISRLVEDATGATWKARITPETVRTIRAMRRAGKPLREIAEACGVSQPSVSVIANGKAWANVPDEAPAAF